LSEFHQWRKSVPWSLVASRESQAKRNHSQSLKQLAERGGLSPRELYAVVRGISWSHITSRDLWDMSEKEAQEIIDEWIIKDNQRATG